MNVKIPLSKPYIDQAEQDAVKEVLESSVLSLGPKTVLFEEMFCSLVGRKYGVAVNSGTSGLHLAVKALGLKNGDRVITTPFSFIASANCLLYEGVRPVFVDIEEDTLGMDPNSLASKISSETKGILPVHVFGQPGRATKTILGLAEKHDLMVIEDACEALFGSYQNQPVGSFGDASVFGFYPNKQITTGEGGMVLTDDEKVYQTIKSLRNQGRSDMDTMNFTQLGYNYRISELTAALGIAQLGKAKEIMQKREFAAETYLTYLSEIDELTLPVQPEDCQHSWFVFAVRVRADWRDLIIAGLGRSGIQSKAYFYPCIHLQPFYREKFGFKEGDFPVAEQVSREVIALPFFTQITEEQIKEVADSIKQIIYELK